MALSSQFLADKSALARFPIAAVAERLRPLMEEGLIATCAIVDLEVLFSSRNRSTTRRSSKNAEASTPLRSPRR